MCMSVDSVALKPDSADVQADLELYGLRVA